MRVKKPCSFYLLSSKRNCVGKVYRIFNFTYLKTRFFAWFRHSSAASRRFVSQRCCRGNAAATARLFPPTAVRALSEAKGTTGDLALNSLNHPFHLDIGRRIRRRFLRDAPQECFVGNDGFTYFC